MEGSEEPSEMKIEADKAAEVPDGGVGESLVTHDESTVENGEMSNGLTTTEENDSNGFVFSVNFTLASPLFDLFCILPGTPSLTASLTASY